MTNLAALRKSYEKAELSEAASHADPLAQFAQWLAEAIHAQLPEPNAMTLATVDQALRPSTRVVLIKGYD
jgi:pyridoxamine 5'-phosphate oxidase